MIQMSNLGFCAYMRRVPQFHRNRPYGSKTAVYLFTLKGLYHDSIFIHARKAQELPAKRTHKAKQKIPRFRESPRIPPKSYQLQREGAQNCEKCRNSPKSKRNSKANQPVSQSRRKTSYSANSRTNKHNRKGF